MNEALENEVVEEPQEDIQEDTQEEQTTEEEVQLTPDPPAGDWMSRAAWEKSGKDPDDWVSKKKFDEQGQIIGDIKRLQLENKNLNDSMTSRLDNQRKLMDAKAKIDIENLQRSRTLAIEEADVVKADQLQGDIDTLRQHAVEPEPAKTEATFSPEDLALVEQFNANNPWVKEDSAKADRMLKRFNMYGNQGMTVENAIANAKSDIDREFPAINPRRSEPATTEGGRSKPGKRGEQKLSWSELSSEELKMYEAVGGTKAWKNKDDFLQAVKDTRAL